MPNESAKQILIEYSPEIILVTIYSKLEQADISAEQIRRILKEFEGQQGI